jgi:uncharacterized protein (DUF1697 family)
MPIYVAMLRGINVGPHKRIRMDELRQSFESLGLERIRTYIQSGNVVFKTVKTAPPELCKRTEKQIFSDFGFSVSVIVRTADQIAKAIERNPFVDEQAIDPERLHVTFLSAALSPAALKKLEALTTAPDRSCCVGGEIYLFLPNGVSESSLMKTPLDRALSVVTTTRNWKTVNALHQMCQDCR